MSAADRIAIDIHCHMLVPEARELVAPYFRPELDEFLRWGGERSMAYNQGAFSELVPLMTDPENRLAQMDRMGVDYQAVAIAPPQYYYWAAPELGAQVAVMENDALARNVEYRPDRFRALGTLPMQSPEAAVAELRRIVTEYDFKGVSINPNAQGVDYDDPGYAEFWSTVHELDVLVVLHPNGTWDGNRLQDYYMINVVGNPMESTIATTKIVMGGVVERHPGIKILAVHGGGYLPFYMDRMDHAAANRPDVSYKITGKPSDHLKQLYFDTVVFGDGLDYLIDRVGADHVLMGTDYPYDMGETDPVARVNRVAGISDDDKAKIIGLNAARLLGLDL
jgi:aminocarboxymuconate-semialdehyde decarboxylase